MTYLSVIVPAYNEEKRLPETISEIVNYLSYKRYKSEIIIAENGSTDDTSAVAQSYLNLFTKHREDVRGRVIHADKGKGAAVKAGMLLGQGTWLYMADADLSTPIEVIDFMTPPEFTGDVAIASRYLPGLEYVVDIPWSRKMSGRFFNIFTSLLVPGITDTQCGFKMFRRDVAQRIFSQSTITGWAFDVEILYLAKLYGYDFEEIPVSWEYDADSRVNILGDSLEMAADLLRIWIRGKMGGYEPQKDPAHA